MEILITLGPSSLNEKVIKRLSDEGASLFRLNLSHIKENELEKLVNYVRQFTEVPICIDTEGAQIRTGDIDKKEISFEADSIVSIPVKKILGNYKNFNLYPSHIIHELRIGDLITIDFNLVLIQIISKNKSRVKARILNPGKIGQNKAVSLERKIYLPPLTNKDIKCLEIGKKIGIENVALSFANRKEDVELIKKHCMKNASIISKIECLNGLINLDEIIEMSDSILIDRGDLSREILIENIPLIQKLIVNKTNNAGKKVYVATNLLESMVTQPIATRAEVNDVYNTIIDGVDGLVLAAESAIGNYPIRCMDLMNRIIDISSVRQQKLSFEFLSNNDALIKPHGGKLINSKISMDEKQKLSKLKTLEVSQTVLLDCEQICIGTYSPLIGMMTKSEMNSVLDYMKLENGEVWTMPVLLQVSKEIANKFNIGEEVSLKHNNKIYSMIHISDISEIDLNIVSEKWFGTRSKDHPGVLKLFNSGNWIIGGKVKLVNKLDNNFPEYTMDPKQFRFLFKNLGWSKVVGFHTRNVLHRVHEFIQLNSLEISNADGLLISPVIGPKKHGDFLESAILESYKVMLDRKLYPENKVILGAFNTYPRYAGPREAVFTALCRKNMGCSHFIIGRDHTGVENFYNIEDNQKIFERVGDIGIKPIFFSEVGYSHKKRKYNFIENEKNLVTISGTKVREDLKNGNQISSWVIRDEIQQLLINKIKKGEEVFFE